MNRNRRRRLLWLLRVGPDTLSDAMPMLTNGRAIADCKSLSSQLARRGQRDTDRPQRSAPLDTDAQM